MTIAKKLGTLAVAFAAVSTSGCSSNTDYGMMIEWYTLGTLGLLIRPFTYNNSDNCDYPASSLPECKNKADKAPVKPDATAPQPKPH